MKRLMIGGAALLLGSCQWFPGTEANAIEAGKRAAAAQLRDPASAQFRNLRFVQADGPDAPIRRAVCGEVNGKNAHGAYAGFTAFVANVDNGQAALDPQTGLSSADVTTAGEACRRGGEEAQTTGFTGSADFACSQAREVLDAATEQADFDALYELCRQPPP